MYQLLSWVEGDDAEAALTNCSESEQYKYGLLSGQMLRKIHSVNAPEGGVGWAKKYTEKIRIKRLKYEACPIKCNNDTKFLEFINHNLSGLEDRKQTFQHGDFHVGNLLLNNCRIGVDLLDLSVFEDNSFDTVVCYGAPLNYVVNNYEKAISELARVTKVGGTILLSVCNKWGVFKRIRRDIFLTLRK